MVTPRVIGSTGRGPGPWPVLAATLVAVALPAALVLWFMTAAVSNERLAVAERLETAYREHLESCSRALDGFWEVKAAAIQEASKLPAPEAFKLIVETKIASSAVLYDEGGVAYPVLRSETLLVQPESPQWAEAERLEFAESQDTQAAEVYLEIARSAEAVGERTRALEGAVRCVARAGEKERAVSLVLGEVPGEEATPPGKQPGDPAWQAAARRPSGTSPFRTRGHGPHG